MANDAGRYARTASTFGTIGQPVAPSDTTDLPTAPVKAVVCLTAGNLAIIPAGNGDVTISFVDVAAGFVPPFQVRRVMATGTTATVATVEG